MMMRTEIIFAVGAKFHGTMDDFLMKMLAHVEQQYCLVERECSILRKLLKPWPKKRLGGQENQSQTAEKQKAECEKNEDKKEMTMEEKLALEQMDRLIGKAQKALKIKEKMLATESSHRGVDNSSGDRESNLALKNDVCVSQQGIQEIRSEVKDNESKSSKSVRGKILTKKKEIPSIKKSQFHITSAKGGKPNDSNTVPSQHPSSRNTTISHSRPPSASSHSRPSSGKSRYTPVHVTAPFKTELNTKVPHRKQNHFYKNHLSKPSNKKPGTISVQKQPSLANGLKTLPKICPATPVQQNEISEYPNEGDKEPEVFNPGSVTGIEDLPISHKSESVVQTTQVEQIVASDVPNFFQIIEDQLADVCGPKTNESQVEEQEALLFSLQDKSSRLKVPSKLSRLVKENYTLLEKCSTVKQVKKTPVADIAQNFIGRLNAQNDVSQELWARVKAIACLQYHNLMLKSLQSLNLEVVSESTPFEALYRIKRLLEFILAKFAQTQDEANYFSKAQFRQTHLLGMDSIISPSNVDFVKSLFAHQGNKSVELMDESLKNILESSKSWTKLNFEKDLYELHKQLLTLSEAEWYEVLSTNQPEQCSVFQMIHGLLTSRGEFLPATVRNPYSDS